jgi:hypothetical protein
VAEDAGGVGQRLEAGKVGGLVVWLAGGGATLATTSGPAVASRVLW